MTVTVRFAPSPTGKLHVGNARAALFNWLFARQQRGTFILRMDDTDTERSTEEHAQQIEQDLAWLGLAHDAYHRQSDRFDRYALAVEKLKEAGRLYPCYETPDELERKRKRQLARGKPPVYDRAGLELTDGDRRQLEAEGKAPHWRFLLDRKPAEWDDLVRGHVRIDLASVSDPILIRADGSYLYTLPSVVDDIELGVTHVIRGDDHVTNTGGQIQLFEALGAELTRFGHYSLLLGPDGRPLSKRLRGEYALDAVRERGFEPMAFASLLAKLGTADAVDPCLSLDELVAEFDLGKLGHSNIRFDMAELERVNAALMHKTPFAAVKDRLAERGIEGGEAFWQVVRPNLTLFDGVAEWWHIVEGPVEPVIEEPEIVAEAAALLPPAPWDGGTWKAWTGAVGAATGLKGRALFMPLRLALTGLHHGPELKNLLPLIGPERATARLKGEKA